MVARAFTALSILLAMGVRAFAQPGTVAPIDPFNRQAVVALYNSAYVAARAVPNDWNGSTASCVAGATSAAYRDATMTSVNYFRAMAGLPSAVTRDPVKDGKAQQAALMMSANSSLNHFPPTTWRCYTADGAEAAGKSNLALGSGGFGAGSAAVGLYMSDSGVADLGHRRWILYPPQATMATGSTNTANALWVLGPFGARPASPGFVAWPNAGFVPYQLVYQRWSFAVNTAASVDFSGATVTMTRDGLPVPVTVFRLANGYGDNTLGFQPSGLGIGAGVADRTFAVTVGNVVVGGVARQFTYTVTVIDPASAPPGTVPGAPTGVTAAAGNGQATVSFLPPSNGGSSAISGYVVTASPGGATANGTGSPLVVTGLTNGTAYTFTVRATNSAGTGPPSAPSAPVTPTGPPSPPGAPTGVSAVAGNARATVTFAAPSTSGSSPISSYRATASPGGATATSTGSPIVVTGLSNGTAYRFTVTASNSVGPGPASAPSSPVTPSASGTPTVGAPTNFAVTSSAGNTMSFAWTVGAGTLPITGYLIEGGVSPGAVQGSVPIAGNVATFTTALPTGVFYVRLYALSGATRSAVSNEIRIFVNVPTPPAAPAHLLGLVNGDAIWLSWVNSAAGGSATGMVLDVTGSLTTSLSFGASESFSTAGVPPGTYTLRVRATNATGISAPSNPVTLSFPGSCSGAPGLPVGFNVVRTGNTLSASWLPPAAGPAPSLYTLSVSGAFVGSFPTTGRGLAGAVGPGTYTFTLTASNVCGSGASTAPQTVVVP